MDGAAVGAEFLLATSIFFATSGVISWVLYNTAKQRPQAMITISVSVLSLVAVVLAVAAASESIATALIGLAGVGLGALSAALREVFGVGDGGSTAPPVQPPVQSPAQDDPEPKNPDSES